jgi:hypothetical protein
LTGFLMAILLAASEALYLMLLRLDAVNGVRPVIIFLAVISAEFALCFAAYYLLRNKAIGSNWWGLMIGGAVLFRITLLPAGLPPELSWGEKFAAMRSDWRGESVTYERFQLFDDDIWRYLCDGHVAARGANPRPPILLSISYSQQKPEATPIGRRSAATSTTRAFPRSIRLWRKWFSAPHIGWRPAACWR